jgi:hypothetical protein
MTPKAFFAAALAQTQSVRKHVSVSVDGVAVPGVTNVSGLNALGQDSVTQQESGNTRRNGLLNSSTGKRRTIVITRKETNSTELQQWHKNV